MNSRAFEIIQPVGLVLLPIPEFQLSTIPRKTENMESAINNAIAALNRASSATVLPRLQVQTVRYLDRSVCIERANSSIDLQLFIVKIIGNS